MNRLVTRGFGPGAVDRAGPITQGFGEAADEDVLVTASRTPSTSDTLRKHDEVNVTYQWARLVEVTPSLAGKRVKADTSKVTATAQRTQGGIRRVLAPKVTARRSG